jgi:hypothetical protein
MEKTDTCVPLDAMLWEEQHLLQHSYQNIWSEFNNKEAIRQGKIIDIL